VVQTTAVITAQGGHRQGYVPLASRLQPIFDDRAESCSTVTVRFDIALHRY